MELTKGKYLIYTNVLSTGISISSNYLMLITNYIKNNKVNKIEKINVGQAYKDVKILNIEPYIKTNSYNDNKEYGLVWTVEVLTNPIPVTLVIYALTGLISVFLVYLSLDKVDKVIETSGEKFFPNLSIIGVIILIILLITKNIIK